ncbi:MAG: hypothetical protein PHW46_02830 [Candidatus Omnitrophica bacterium]|nr:hypothetical protein [Candidatus Omnitrophota bacterium]
MSNYFAVLDADAASVSAVLAKWQKNNAFSIEGTCSVTSKGIRKGVIVDSVLATDSIEEVLRELQNRTKKRFKDVFVSVSSPTVDIIPSSGVLLLSKYGREISNKDLRKAVEIASTIKLPLDKEVLHKVVCDYSIDGEEGIKSPLNLEAVKLGVKIKIVAISSSLVRNISRCIIGAGFMPAGFVLSSLALSYRFLTVEDKTDGAALLNISDDLTEAMVFSNNVLSDCMVFSAGSSIFLAGEALDTRSVEELLTNMRALSGWDKVKKVVIVGSGVLIDGLVEFLEKALNMEVIIGTSRHSSSEKANEGDIKYTGLLGVLDHLQKERRELYSDGNVFQQAINRAVNFFDKYF